MNGYNWETSAILLPDCNIFEMFLMAFGHAGPTCIENTCNVAYT